MKLNVYNDNWALDEAVCPCDIHFMRWVRQSGLRGGSIFHFGTGGHHLVGIECAAPDLDIAVLGITASPQEYDDYVRLLIDNPKIGRQYKAYFGDIYQLDARMLPHFDVVTLFHLCEFRNESNDLYDGLTDLEVAQLLVDRLKPGGHVLFYTGSFAFEKAKPDIAALALSHGLQRCPDHESLWVFRKPG